MHLQAVISSVILLTVLDVKAARRQHKTVMTDEPNDVSGGVCKVSCDKLDAIEKKLDKLLAKNCKACTSSPCLNNGVCTDLVDGYNCTCVAGYDGSRCQNNIDECSSSPCLNNGNCTDLVNGYKCTCAPGYNGSRCETDIDECFNSPCLNNGVCTDLVNGYKCNCPAGFEGNHCEKAVKSFKMDSRIISGNKSYENELKKLLAPAVGDQQQWKLCYRRSTDDGWSHYKKAFHSKCDGKPNTVVLVKAGDYVFGGFTDVAWKLPPPNRGTNYGSTRNAFIFSLRNKEGVPPFKAMVAVPQYAILSTSAYDGPQFTIDLTLLSYWDRKQTGKSSACKLGQYYTTPSNVQSAIGGRYMYLAGTYRFEPDEVEVFYLA